MITIQTFIFNPFQTNTYLLYDETNECVIIDAACESDREKERLADFIKNQNLTPVRLLYTHLHVDHALGNTFITEKYNLSPEVHPKGKLFWESAREFSSVFNIKFEKPMEPTVFLHDGDEVTFGNSTLQVLYTPGHADGSVCFWNKKQKFVVVGDVLFQDSIGRTDLPTGNYDLLIKSIKEKLLVLDDDTVVYCGHGPETTIGYEKNHNPYFDLS